MLVLGFVIALGVLALLFYIVWIVKPDHIELSAFLVKIFNVTLKAGRKGLEQIEPAKEESSSKDDGSA